MAFATRVLARHKGLTQAQLLICQEFVMYPDAGKDRLAELASCSVRTVERWLADPQFWAIVGEFDISQMQRAQVLALASAKLRELLGRAGKLNAEDGAWLDRLARWTGIERAAGPSAVAVSVSGTSELGARTAARAAELAAGIQAELFGPDSQAQRCPSGEGSGEKRVADSVEAGATVPAGGAA